MLGRIIFLTITITAALIGRANADGNEAEDFFIGLGVMSWVLYFVPSIIALLRRHHNLIPIIILNAFLGWTIIGWIVALIWSFTADVESRRLFSPPMASMGYGPPRDLPQGRQPPSGGFPREYRGYPYVVEEDGRARLKLFSGEWRTYPSEEMVKRDIDVWRDS